VEKVSDKRFECIGIKPVEWEWRYSRYSGHTFVTDENAKIADIQTEGGGDGGQLGGSRSMRSRFPSAYGLLRNTEPHRQILGFSILAASLAAASALPNA
jgi:hypothetical protein